MAEAKKQNWFMKHKVITGILAVFLLIVVVSATSSSDETNTASSDESSASNSEEPNVESNSEIAKIGTPVRDGKFEFTVNGVECGATTLGNEFFNEKAQGQFCVMDVSVKNIGNEAQLFSGSDQLVFNAAGQQYSNDSSAEIALEENDTFLEEINPGNTVEGRVVFDIPKDQKLVKAELHDSSFSNGVEVSLE